jgi:hypothetical protein
VVGPNPDAHQSQARMPGNPEGHVTWTRPTPAEEGGHQAASCRKWEVLILCVLSPGTRVLRATFEPTVSYVSHRSQSGTETPPSAKAIQKHGTSGGSRKATCTKSLSLCPGEGQGTARVPQGEEIGRAW